MRRKPVQLHWRPGVSRQSTKSYRQRVITNSSRYPGDDRCSCATAAFSAAALTAVTGCARKRGTGILRPVQDASFNQGCAVQNRHDFDAAPRCGKVFVISLWLKRPAQARLPTRWRVNGLRLKFLNDARV
jgi:hypothetical protein